VKDYQTIRRDWHVADAFVLEVLPRELIFLYEELFRCPKDQVLSWLINVGHRIAVDLLEALRTGMVNGFHPQEGSVGGQMALESIRTDEVALPILSAAASMESVVETRDPKTAAVRYVSRLAA